MVSTMSKSDRTGWLVTLVLALIPLLIPTNDVYTLNVKLFLVITIAGLSITAFELAPLLFVSITMPALWIFLNVAPAKVVMSPWLGSTFLMITGALFIAATLEESGLLKRISCILMCKVKGNYLALMFAIFFTGIILNIMTSGRGYMILAPLIAGLVFSLDGANKKLGAGLAMAVMLGGCTSHSFTYQGTAWALLYSIGSDYISQEVITPLSITLCNWPLMVVAMFIVWVMSKMFKPEQDLTDLSYFQKSLAEMGSMTKREKVNLVMLITLLVYVFTVDLHHLDLNLGFAIIPFMVYLPGLDGADAQTVKKVNFSVIFFCAACMSIGTIANSLGLGDAIASACQTVLGGSSNPFLIMLLVFLIVFALNFLMTPMAIFALITVPILSLVTSMGLPAVPFAYAINACTEAIIFPYEYVPYLIVFSFGMISMKDFIKANIVRSVLFFTGFLVVLVPYWMLIGLL